MCLISILILGLMLVRLLLSAIDADVDNGGAETDTTAKFPSRERETNAIGTVIKRKSLRGTEKRGPVEIVAPDEHVAKPATEVKPPSEAMALMIDMSSKAKEEQVIEEEETMAGEAEEAVAGEEAEEEDEAEKVAAMAMQEHLQGREKWQVVPAFRVTAQEHLVAMRAQDAAEEQTHANKRLGVG